MRTLAIALALLAGFLGWRLYASGLEVDRLAEIAGEATRAVGESERANAWTRAIDQMIEVCSASDAYLVGALIHIKDGLPASGQIGCEPNPRKA